MATKSTIEEKLAWVKARTAAAAKKAKPKTKAMAMAMAKVEQAKQLSLELWPEAVRGVPNAVLRSALFGVSKTREVHKKRTMVAAVEGYDIRFKGEMFNQTDLDVWETLLHLARLQPLGTQVEFTAHSLLKQLGRGTSGKHHEELKEQLMRLIGGAVEITWTKERRAFAGALVSSYFRDDETGRYVVKFNPDMAKLYGVGHTLIDWSERQSLGQDLLAKWLHGHYASHAAPYPYKVTTLRTWSRSTVERLGDFRKQLRLALNKLVANGSLKSWSIDPDTDLVHVVNIPSSAQLKHLAKPRIRA
jgi:hypothetical protein